MVNNKAGNTVVKAEVPMLDGVPESSPVVPSRVRPGGRFPLPTEKVGAGIPVAAKVYR